MVPHAGRRHAEKPEQQWAREFMHRNGMEAFMDTILCNYSESTRGNIEMNWLLMMMMNCGPVQEGRQPASHSVSSGKKNAGGTEPAEEVIY